MKNMKKGMVKMKKNVRVILVILFILFISIAFIFYFQNKKNATSSKVNPETEEIENEDEINDEEEEKDFETKQEIDNTSEEQKISKSQENTREKENNSSVNTQVKTNNINENQPKGETVTSNTKPIEQTTSTSENMIIITETKKPVLAENPTPTTVDTNSNNIVTNNTSSDKINSDSNSSIKDAIANNSSNNLDKPDNTSSNKSDKIDQDATTPDKDKDKNDKENKDDKLNTSKTAQEVINEMGAGWNLGNTLDSTNYQKEFLNSKKNISYYETLWGNPITTKNMIDAIKKAGFKSIRVPVTYYDHTLKDGTIDEKWLDRVEEVINYVLKNNMYCILDIHHDTGLYTGGTYIVADADKFEENAKKLKKMWLQIGTSFKDYDDHLIFEGFNEMVDQNKTYDWNSGYQHTLTVYKLNQVFVDTVRSIGGKNATRFLAVSTFGSITDDQKLSTFTLPKDTAKDKIILALHDYADTTSSINSMFERIEKYCRSKNIPVILDEYGMFKTKFKTEEERAKMTGYYVSKAKKLNIACYWWDNGKKEEYSIFNRKNLTWEYPKIKDAIIKAS